MSNLCFKKQKTNTVIDYCNITENDYFCQIKKLLNLGPIWCIIENNNSLFNKILKIISDTFFDVHQYICKLSLEANPCTSECNIDDWIKVFGLNENICGEATVTKEIVCQYYLNNSTFDCELIENLVVAEGYTLLECETICDISDEDIIRNNGCEDSFGAFKANPNLIVYQNNTDCQIKSINAICENCCVDEDVDVENVQIISPCENTRILGGCKFCGCKKAGFYFKKNETYNPLCLPSTIKIKLAGPPPCVGHVNFGTNFGRQFYSNESAFSICSLEALKPLHIDIIYEFEETC